MKKLAMLLTLGTVMFTTGCSRWDWAIRFADVYLMSEADRLFDLTREQERRLKPEVQTVIKEIRRQDFPVFAEFLQRIATGVESASEEGIKKDQIDAWFLEGKRSLSLVMRRFEPAALDLARDAGDEQAKSFEEEFKRSTDKLRKRTDTEKKLYERDFERAERWFEMWIRRPTKEQQRMLEEYVRGNPSPINEQLQHREKMLADFLAVKGDARIEWIKKFYENPDALREPSYAAKMDTREAKLRDFLFRIGQTMSKEQKEYLTKDLREKAAQLQRLSVVK